MSDYIPIIAVFAFVIICAIIANRKDKAQRAKYDKEREAFKERIRKQSEHLKRKKI